MGENLREMSKRALTGNVTHASINAGSLQRIADATEVMAKRYNNLIDDRNRCKRWYEEERDSNYSLRKTIAGLKGYITRLKRKING